MRELLAVAKLSSAAEDELAMVLAAAGVLTAAGWDWATTFDPARAQQAMKSLGARRIWKRPPPTAHDAIGSFASRIVDTWMHSFAGAGEPGPTRLLLIPTHRQWTDDERSALSTLSHAMLGGLMRWRGRGQGWRQMDRSTIGSVAIQTSPLAGELDHWKWPLRLSLEGIEPKEFDITFRPAERGIARSVMLGVRSDYAIVRSLRGLEAANASFATLVSPWRNDLAESLLDFDLHRSIGAMAWIQGTGLDLEALAKALIYETAHDATPDLALSLAWLWEGGQTAPPIVFASHDFFERMDAARLSQSVQDLSRKLEALGVEDDSPISISRSAAHWLGVPRLIVARPSHLAEGIGRALDEDRISYASEEHAAHSTAEVTSLVDDRIVDTRRSAEAELSPRETLPIGADQLAETERYSDLSLLDTHWWLGDVIGAEARHALGAPLEAAAQYTLEVAIRARTFAGNDGRNPIAAPRRDKEPITLYARVLPRADIELEDLLLPITWPFDEDSTPALFRFRTNAAFKGGTLLEARLLTSDLRLLDQIKLVFEEQTWRVYQVDAVAKLTRPDGAPARDALSLAVSGAKNGYAVHAELVRDGGEPLAVPLSQAMRAQDVTGLLDGVRRHWTKLVIGMMSTRDGLSEPSYKQAVDTLGQFGRSAWRLLFGNKQGAQAGASEAFGQLLADNPLPAGAFVRISFSDDALDFTFPWTILTPPQRDGNTASREPWGLSYQIEIARPQGRTPPPKKGPVRITATIDDGFVKFVDHRKTLDEIVAAHRDVGLASADVNDEIKAALSADDPSDIFYFFCHGMMASAPPALRTEMQSEITTALQVLDSASREPWQLLIKALGGAEHGARISSSRADLNETALGDVDFFKNLRRPLVFLNMCHSASSVPASRTGLPAVFLDRNAIAVIGTEAPITARFGDAFARAMLGQLLDGEALGTAMLSARRAFHEKRNPLALIYTLYGRSDTRLVLPRQEEKSRTPDDVPKEKVP